MVWIRTLTRSLLSFASTLTYSCRPTVNIICQQIYFSAATAPFAAASCFFFLLNSHIKSIISSADRVRDKTTNTGSGRGRRMYLPLLLLNETDMISKKAGLINIYPHFGALVILAGVNGDDILIGFGKLVGDTVYNFGQLVNVHALVLQFLSGLVGDES